ncbi:basic proline-rich protein-like [Choloepus didactylus]|uniref:basic proline-rich protein-like n=1 Tax=Choloepus didactylus TaxID=27675 RepID=UPI00189D2D98|nr:basic proline-rich protein-like [Choloepus didactylus]
MRRGALCATLKASTASPPSPQMPRVHSPCADSPSRLPVLPQGALSVPPAWCLPCARACRGSPLPSAPPGPHSTHTSLLGPEPRALQAQLEAPAQPLCSCQAVCPSADHQAVHVTHTEGTIGFESLDFWGAHSSRPPGEEEEDEQKRWGGDANAPSSGGRKSNPEARRLQGPLPGSGLWLPSSVAGRCAVPPPPLIPGPVPGAPAQGVRGVRGGTFPSSHACLRIAPSERRLCTREAGSALGRKSWSPAGPCHCPGRDPPPGPSSASPCPPERPTRRAVPGATVQHCAPAGRGTQMAPWPPPRHRHVLAAPAGGSPLLPAPGAHGPPHAGPRPAVTSGGETVTPQRRQGGARVPYGPRAAAKHGACRAASLDVAKRPAGRCGPAQRWDVTASAPWTAPAHWAAHGRRPPLADAGGVNARAPVAARRRCGTRLREPGTRAARDGGGGRRPPPRTCGGPLGRRRRRGSGGRSRSGSASGARSGGRAAEASPGRGATAAAEAQSPADRRPSPGPEPRGPPLLARVPAPRTPRPSPGSQPRGPPPLTRAPAPRTPAPHPGPSLQPRGPRSSPGSQPCLPLAPHRVPAPRTPRSSPGPQP